MTDKKALIKRIICSKNIFYIEQLNEVIIQIDELIREEKEKARRDLLEKVKTKLKKSIVDVCESDEGIDLFFEELEKELK